MNGHKMRTLVVPAGFNYLEDAAQPFVNVGLWSMSDLGLCWANDLSISTSPDIGGKSLHKINGEKAPYIGQSFLLTVPDWALSKRGRKAADEYDRSWK